MKSTGVAGKETAAEKDMPTQLVPVKANLCSLVMRLSWERLEGMYVTKFRTFRFIFNYSIQNLAPIIEYTRHQNLKCW